MDNFNKNNYCRYKKVYYICSMENTKTPFEMGWDASKHFNYFATEGENPFELNSDEFKEWEKGWQWYITQTIEWERDEQSDIDYHENQQYCNE